MANWRVYFSTLPKVSNMPAVRNYYHSSCQSMENALNHIFSHGMGANVNHTWSHNIDNQGVRYVGFNRIAAIRGSATNDLRHRVTITMSWDLPFGYPDLAW